MKRCMIVVLVALLAGGRAEGQTVVPEEVSCAKCTISTRVITRLGVEDGPGSIPMRPSSVVFDGRARYWVSMDGFFPMVFDATGRFLREFGKKGSGPGEFESAWVVMALPGDSVLVRGDHRFVVVAPDFSQARYIRTDGSTMVRSLVRWPDVTVNSVLLYNQRPGATRWELGSASGEDITHGRSMLQLPTGPGPIVFAASHRAVSPIAGDHFWLANRSQYRLVRYDARGVATDSMQRRIAWFPGGEGLGWGSKDNPPSPRLANIWEDREGLVWVVVAQPRRDYAKAWEGRKPLGNEVSLQDLPPDEMLWRSFVEVIDPRAKRVVARHTLDGYVLSVLPANRIATSAENEDGVPFITIHQLMLNRN